MRSLTLRSARFIAADYLRHFLLPGDIAVDATMGNGHDTALLCELVGESGHVYAFDIQEEALVQTRDRLSRVGLLPRATLFHTGHEHMASYVPQAVHAVLFNLGWLPGGDHRITTRWKTTRQAVLQALSLLTEEGLCVICVYPGHEEGKHELEQMIALLSQLRPQDFNVLQHCFINAGEGAPVCFVLQKQMDASFNLSRENT